MAISEVQWPATVKPHRFKSPAQLARTLAADVAGRLRAAIAGQGTATLVVSGGRSPVAFFEALAQEALDWSKVVVSLADERWVPVEHADSNAGLVRRHLLQGDAARARFIGLYRSAPSLEAAAAEADHALAQLPPIDVLVLGMGDDGHTASLFPGSPNLDEGLRADSERRCLAMLAPTVPHQRLSLTRRLLATAGFTALAVQGEGKLATLRAALADNDPTQMPIRAFLHDPWTSTGAHEPRISAMTTLERPKPLLTMAEKIARIDAICGQARILPVITIAREADILPLADALAAGGIRTLEVTLRSEHGLKAIKLLREQRPELCVGAGTVLDRNLFAAVEEAGAQFVVTPGITPEILQAGVDSDIPLLPGISTPSEIMMGYALGYRRFKLFPAEISGGVAAIKAYAGPFADVRFCPTGGVKPDNLKSYMNLPNVMCVGGTWMLDSGWIRNGDWAAVEKCSAEAMALLNE